MNRQTIPIFDGFPQSPDFGDPGGFDVCVIGSGPVGLALAVDLTKRGLRVIVIEAGGRRPDGRASDFGFGALLTPENHASMADAMCRALGGTSWNWGGRCVPLDNIDFAHRAHVPDGRWPISHEDVVPYYAPAASLLSFKGNFEGGPLPGTDKCVEFQADRLERWCVEPRVGPDLIAQARPGRLTVILEATVIGFRFVADLSRIAAIVLHSRGRTFEFAGAACFVIAGGGLETARLLLNVQCDHPRLFGGANGPLGRHYMGHLSGRIATIRFAEPATARSFGYRFDDRSVSRRRFSLHAKLHHELALPNIAFWPDNPPLHDPAHGSGLLSALYLTLSMPVAGRGLVADAIRRNQVGDGGQIPRHVANIVKDLPRTGLGLADLLSQRLLRKRRIPALLVHRRDGRHPLHFHAEHLANNASRVRLADDRDRSGLRKLSVALQFSEADGAGVVRAHEALARGVAASGLAEIAFDEGDDPAARVVSGSVDGFHQIGLARMGLSSVDGVVDRECRVFGVNNLFIAGSAVFRTSGQANPTFPAIALALRLGAHIAATATAMPIVSTRQ